MIDPAVVLFMLREGPRRPLVLAQWLSVSRDALRPILRQLQAAGKIRRLADNRVALAAHRTIHEHRAEERQQPIVSNARPVHVAAQPKPTRVVNGQVFEIVDYEKLLKDRDWPRGGSSLSGYEMGLSVRR